MAILKFFIFSFAILIAYINKTRCFSCEYHCLQESVNQCCKSFNCFFTSKMYFSSSYYFKVFNFIILFNYLIYFFICKINAIFKYSFLSLFFLFVGNFYFLICFFAISTINKYFNWFICMNSNKFTDCFFIKLLKNDTYYGNIVNALLLTDLVF